MIIKEKSLDAKTINELQLRAEQMHKTEPAYSKSAAWEMMLMFIFAALIAVAFNTFVFRIIRVDGISMEPTFYTDQRVFVDKLVYNFRRPKRGEILICYYNRNGMLIKGDDPVIKRVIAVEGESVEIREGKLYVNEKELDEKSYWNSYIAKDMPQYIVPEKCVFVVGDNRNHSDDSRNPNIEAVHDENIIGLVRFRIWPFDQITKIEPDETIKLIEQ